MNFSLKQWRAISRVNARVIPFAIGLAASLLLSGCAAFGLGGSGQGAGQGVVTSLRFIGEQRISHRAEFAGTRVGGLSGIDYDPKTGLWVMVSDDRSDIDPARFYTARLDFDREAFRSVSLTGTTPLLQADRTAYPNRAAYVKGRGDVPDTEAIRVDPRDGSVWYTSEGDRALGLEPFLAHADRNGALVGRVATPPMFSMSPDTEAGSRNNDTYEGLAFSQDAQSLWVAMEAPIYEDGALPTVDAGAYSRITQYSRSGAVMRQVAYPIGPIPGKTTPGKSASNGIAEILAVDADHFLVLERAGIQAADGRYTNVIRIYEMNVAHATDVYDMKSLKGARFEPATRRLVLDLAELGLPRLDNIEGMAWGPLLGGETVSHGKPNASLVLVSDDNFNPAQVTQLLAFEVTTRGTAAP